MPDFNTAFAVIGFSITMPLMMFLTVLFVAYALGLLLAIIKKLVSERLIQIHGLIKVQGMYANRRYLTFVWDKQKHTKETGDYDE